jgi:hypothetical protein
MRRRRDDSGFSVEDRGYEELLQPMGSKSSTLFRGLFMIAKDLVPLAVPDPNGIMKI